MPTTTSVEGLKLLWLRCKIAFPDFKPLHSLVKLVWHCQTQVFHICWLQMLHDEVDYCGNGLHVLSTSSGAGCHHLYAVVLAVLRSDPEAR
jgi:hypothetical protein